MLYDFGRNNCVKRSFRSKKFRWIGLYTEIIKVTVCMGFVCQRSSYGIILNTYCSVAKLRQLPNQSSISTTHVHNPTRLTLFRKFENLWRYIATRRSANIFGPSVI